MIYDMFLFLDEVELLEIRLAELYNVVDKFVICEGNKTFSGKDRDFIFNKNIFKKFEDKIIHIPTFFWNQYCSTWDREIYQRNNVMNIIDFQDNDFIMVSDIDEILNHECIKYIKQNDLERVYEFHLNWYHYKFNLKLENQWNPGVKVTSYKVLKNNYEKNLYKLRSNNYGNHVFYNNAGWHFSYCCDIKNKIQSYSHQENNKPEIIDNIDNFIHEKKVFWNPEYKLEINDNGLPKYLIENKEKFKNFFMD